MLPTYTNVQCFKMNSPVEDSQPVDGVDKYLSGSSKEILDDILARGKEEFNRQLQPRSLFSESSREAAVSFDSLVVKQEPSNELVEGERVEGPGDIVAASGPRSGHISDEEEPESFESHELLVHLNETVTGVALQKGKRKIESSAQDKKSGGKQVETPEIVESSREAVIRECEEAYLQECRREEEHLVECLEIFQVYRDCQFEGDLCDCQSFELRSCKTDAAPIGARDLSCYNTLAYSTLPRPIPIVPLWEKKGYNPIVSFYPGKGKSVVRGSDFVFLKSMPLPYLLPQCIPFGPFCFRTFYCGKPERVVLEDYLQLRFTAPTRDILFWFCFDKFVHR